MAEKRPLHQPTAAVNVQDLAIDVDPGEVRRYLGYRRGQSPRPRVARRLEELWDEAAALVSPRGAYRLVEGGDAEAVAIPRPTPRLALAVCTIGRRLEDESRRRGEAGAFLDSLILDAFGSAAAEAAADALNRRICAEARGAGHHPAARVSPGYGRWRLEAQKALLGLLPAADVGVELTPTLMLVPHKSVSFAVRFEEKPQRAESRRQRCRRCGLTSCPYRYLPDEDVPVH